MNFDINKIVNNLLLPLSIKHRKIISGRYGLNTAFKTLQELGDELYITRERVRQIQNNSVKKIKRFIQEENKSNELVDFAAAYLLGAGGVKEDEAFINDIVLSLKLNPRIPFLFNKIKFILLMYGKPFYEEETDKMKAYWYSSPKNQEEFLKFIRDITNFLKNNKKESILKSKIYLNKIPTLAHCQFLTIPKNLAINTFGYFGFKDWPEIMPKTIRNKVYLVLQEAKKPLHFREIAKQIFKFKLEKKLPHIQTVHNELIKDERFVLVGRGLYTLKEYGFEPGTVKDVLMKILKKHGPLKKEKIVELVKSQRIVKESTILLNLQNKTYFQKLPDGKFDVKEI